jgi:hypothetical protein
MFKLKTLVAAGGVAAAAAAVAVAVVLLRHPVGGGDTPPAEPPAPPFRDVAAAAGLAFRTHFLSGEQGEKYKINLYDHGCGVAVGDFDGDGRDDVYFCNQLGPNALYRNNGDGTFEDVTERAGVGLGDRVCVAAAWADYRNDGRPGLFVTSVRGGNVLFRNNGNGTFTDVTKEAGLAHVGHSQAIAFFDYDNDGFLDLLVTNTGQWTTEDYDAASAYYAGKATLGDMVRSPKEYNILYHNNRDGTFTDVTEKSGLKGQGWGADVAVLDYNEDGYPDVLITSMFGPSQLYRNNRDGTFTDVTRETLGRTPVGGMGARAFDFNNDGKLDLIIVDMHSDMWMDSKTDPATIEEHKKYSKFTGPKTDPKTMENEKLFADAIHLRYEDVVFGNTLHKNLGGGKFEEMSDRANVETFWPWGVAIADFDNDGYEDVFVPSGMGYPFFYWPNYLLMNNGDETFTDRARADGIEPPAGGLYLGEEIRGKPMARSARAAAVADFEGNGQMGIVVNNFNGPASYFRNNFPRRNYLALRLTGTRSNRDAVGAVVRAYAGGQVLTRQVGAAGGYLAQSSKVVHFGLGDRGRVDRVEVRWPSGAVQVLAAPALNTLHHLTEPER